MTIRQLYELNRNIKCWSDINSEDEDCENRLYIEFLIEDSSTGKFPFCDMYEIQQNRIKDSKTEEGHAEIWDFKVKSYYLETDYQDIDLIRMRVKI